MEKICIKFGYPTSLEEQDKLSDRAVLYEYSLEEELCFGFKEMLSSLRKKKGDENFFDLVFLMIAETYVTAPKVSFGTYIENRHKLPMIVLNNNYLKTSNSVDIYISDQYIDEFGQLYQDEFDYEYVGFERVTEF